MKYYVAIVVLASLGIFLTAMYAKSAPEMDDVDIWDAVAAAHEEICVLQTDLFKTQLLQWKANIRESGGTTPAHMAVLLKLLREVKARVRSLRIQIEDLEE